MADESNLSVLQIAAESDMLVKLHLNGCETIIPVKNLLKINPNNEEISDTASYTILRHCALSSLFKFMPNQEIPEFAWTSFVTHITYKDDYQNELLISSDDELTNVLKQVCTESMMDDNDGVVLKVGCKIVNNYRCREIQKIREAATVAADNAFRTMKLWLQGTKSFLDSKRSEFNSRMDRSGKDYVLIHNQADDEEGSESATEHWASRFVQFLLAPETMYHLPEDTPKCHQRSKVSSWDGNNALDDLVQNAVQDAVQTVSFVIEEGFARASKLFNEAIEHQKKNSRKRLTFSTPTLSPTPSLASNESSHSTDSEISKEGLKDGSNCEEDGVINQNIEIVFDKKDKNAAEWKIFFGNEEVCGDDVFVIEEPDEVLSVESFCSSSASGKELTSDLSMISSSSDNGSSSFEQVSKADDDNDSGSWAMLDEE